MTSNRILRILFSHIALETGPPYRSLRSVWRGFEPLHENKLVQVHHGDSNLGLTQHTCAPVEMKHLPSMTLLREVRARLFPDMPRDKQEELAQEMNFKHKENIIYYEDGQGWSKP